MTSVEERSARRARERYEARKRAYHTRKQKIEADLAKRIERTHKEAQTDAVRDLAIAVATADDPLLSEPVWHVHGAS